MAVAELPYNPLPDGHPILEWIQPLGRGAQGHVHLCRDKRTQELLAVKFIERGEKVASDVQHVLSEILNHRLLHHAHVVQFREVMLSPSHLCIAMEYVPDGDMFTLIQKLAAKRLGEPHARWFFQQLITAIDYCHKMGVANRDVKLENTLVAGQIIKLCDFGYAKNSQFASAPNTRVGTPAYLAPEVLTCTRGRTYAGPPVDVWSAGVMLYVMLTGSYPFERADDRGRADRVQRMCQRILTVDYVIPDYLGISQECRDLLARLLVADPNARITIPQICQHPWFISGLPPKALPLNQALHPLPDGLQSEAEIRQLVDAACNPAALNLNLLDDTLDEMMLQGSGQGHSLLISAPHHPQFNSLDMAVFGSPGAALPSGLM